MSGMLRLAWANMVHRKSRCLLTLAGVAVAVASFVGLYTLARGPERVWQNSLGEADIHVIGYERGVVHIITGQLPLALAGRIRAIPGVAAVSPQISRFVPLESEEQQVVLVGMPVDSRFWDAVRIRSGRKPMPGEVWSAVLGSNIAAALRKKTGDTLTILWRDFRVVGIAAQDNPMNDSTIMAPLEALQILGRSEKTATLFAVRLAAPGDPDRTRAVLAALNALEPTAVFVETKDITRSSQVLRMLQAVSWFVSVIAIGMGLLVVSITLVMSIHERTREFGILGAVGWSAGRIALLVVIEGIIVAALGGALGSLGGVALAFALAAHPVLSGLLEPVFSAELFIGIAASVAAIGLLGALYPAWLAARITPARALQYE